MQLPHQAIKDVTQKLSEPGCEIARYTHDLSTLESACQAAVALGVATPVECMLDVGWVCKRCHMVYPRQEACLRHRCMLDGSIPSSSPPPTSLKLEQIQYACGACGDDSSQARCSTVSELQEHIIEKHRLVNSEDNSTAIEVEENMQVKVVGEIKKEKIEQEESLVEEEMVKDEKIAEAAIKESVQLQEDIVAIKVEESIPKDDSKVSEDINNQVEQEEMDVEMKDVQQEKEKVGDNEEKEKEEEK